MVVNPSTRSRGAGELQSEVLGSVLLGVYGMECTRVHHFFFRLPLKHSPTFTITTVNIPSKLAMDKSDAEYMR